jgi:CubicO group peptidase (beta-lactamase class C family)/D-alanyl-D-alanine dipeptidase
MFALWWQSRARRARRLLAVALAIPAAMAACSSASTDGPPGRSDVARATVGPAPGYDSLSAALARFIEREMRDKAIPALSIALVEGDSTVWAAGFGTERPATQRPADAHTVYRVGSVSKLFTDIGVMQLAERGDVDLDAPVTRYLPDFTPRNPYGTPITLRQLMSHHAGLVREPPAGHYFDDSGTTLAATVASLTGTTLVHEPGSTGKYSNAAIAVVGWLLEQRSGEPFASYLKRAVLQPMGLRQSAFTPESALVERLASGQMWTLHHRTFDAPTFELGMVPAGSMYSTMPDLARFLRVLFAGGRAAGGTQVLKHETLEQMWQPQFAPTGARTGLGIGFIIGELEGRRTVNHGGAIYGFATQLSAIPDARLGVAVSAAKDGMNALTDRIAAEALRLLLARQEGRALPAIDTTGAVPLAAARRLVGSYGRGASRVELVVRDSTVVLHGAGSDHPQQLRAWRGDTLLADDGMSFGTKAWPQGTSLVVDGTVYERRPPAKALPAPPPAAWTGLIGEYGWDHNVLYIFERDGELRALIEWFFDYPLRHVQGDTFAFPERGLYSAERVVFTRGADGRARAAVAAGIAFTRRTWVGEDGDVFRITPVKPVGQLRTEALAASPPAEPGEFRESDLAELVTLDSTIRLDVRYATDRNFLSVPVYTQARAFLQRPAAEALVRAHRRLRASGYGLLIHDGYRPWYVTRMFWDGTPEDKHTFVADPSRGSRHNRGCAVDLTLFDLRTGEPVVMTGGYDEMSDRSYPEYPGGTSRQRALRELLRSAMEGEGFTVYEAEWWHFDYKDWRHYRIGNQRFEDLGT